MSDFPEPSPWPSLDQPPPGFPQPPPPFPFPDQPPLEFPQHPRNGLGIAALILGIIGVVAGFIPFLYWFSGIFGIVGLILGFIGRGRAKRGEATNGTMALWGIITSAVVVVLSIVELVFLIMGSEWSVELSVGPVVVVGDTSPAIENTVSPAVETSAPARADAEKVSVLDLASGDCLADSLPGGGEEVFSVKSVPCSEPHSEEIYATVTLPDGDFPGEEAVVEQADESCTAEFESFVGLPYEESALYLSYLTPSEETWPAGDREVLCTVYDPAGDTTGTLFDANR